MTKYIITFVITRQEEIEIDDEEKSQYTINDIASMASELISQEYDYDMTDWEIASIEIEETK